METTIFPTPPTLPTHFCVRHCLKQKQNMWWKHPILWYSRGQNSCFENPTSILQHPNAFIVWNATSIPMRHCWQFRPLLCFSWLTVISWVAGAFLGSPLFGRFLLFVILERFFLNLCRCGLKAGRGRLCFAYVDAATVFSCWTYLIVDVAQLEVRTERRYVFESHTPALPCFRANCYASKIPFPDRTAPTT